MAIKYLGPLEEAKEDEIVKTAVPSVKYLGPLNASAEVEPIVESTKPRSSVAVEDSVVPKSSKLRRYVADPLLSLGKGVIALPESVVGLADIPTGGRVGKALEDTIGYKPKEAREFLDTLMTPEQKEASRKVSETEGFIPTVKAAMRSPSVIAHSVFESGPSMIGAGGIGKMAIKVLPKLAPLVAGAIGEGLISAGQTAEQVREESDTGLITPKQSTIATASGALTSMFGIVGGKIAKKLGIIDPDTWLASSVGNPQKKAGILRSIVEGIITEGALEELPQSAQEQMAQNMATDRPLMDGVTNAAVMGMLTGGAMGGGANVINQVLSGPGAAKKEKTEPVLPIDMLATEKVVPQPKKTFNLAEPKAKPFADIGEEMGVTPAEEARLGREWTKEPQTTEQLTPDEPTDAEIIRQWEEGRAEDVIPQSLTAIDQKAHEAATSPLNDLTEPSEPQKAAGNYKKGHINFQGLDISIENPVGSIRSGKDKGGKAWETKMKLAHYGYLKGVEGKDKDHLDVFVGSNPESQQVFVVNQINPKTKKFDEHKVIIGTNSEEEARKAYLSNYEKGWKGLKSIAPMSMAEFKTWTKEGNTKAEAKASKAKVDTGDISKAVVPQKQKGQTDEHLDVPIAGYSNSWTEDYEATEEAHKKDFDTLKELEGKMKAATGKGSGDIRKTLKKQIDDIKEKYARAMGAIEEKHTAQSIQLSNKIEQMARDSGITDEDTIFNITEDIINTASDTRYLENHPNWSTVTPRQLFDEIMADRDKDTGRIEDEQKSSAVVPEQSQQLKEEDNELKAIHSQFNMPRLLTEAEKEGLSPHEVGKDFEGEDNGIGAFNVGDYVLNTFNGEIYLIKEKGLKAKYGRTSSKLINIEDGMFSEETEDTGVHRTIFQKVTPKEGAEIKVPEGREKLTLAEQIKKAGEKAINKNKTAQKERNNRHIQENLLIPPVEFDQSKRPVYTVPKDYILDAVEMSHGKTGGDLYRVINASDMDFQKGNEITPNTEKVHEGPDGQKLPATWFTTDLAHAIEDISIAKTIPVLMKMKADELPGDKFFISNSSPVNDISNLYIGVPANIKKSSVEFIPLTDKIKSDILESERGKYDEILTEADRLQDTGAKGSRADDSKTGVRKGEFNRPDRSGQSSKRTTAATEEVKPATKETPAQKKARQKANNAKLKGKSKKDAESTPVFIAKKYSIEKDEGEQGTSKLQDSKFKAELKKYSLAKTPVYGETNKVFTKDRADKAREILKKKLNQLNVGLDPEMITAGMDLAGYHIEAGARSFAEYSKRMIADLGEAIRPYLKSFYMAVRSYPDFDNKDMDTEAEIGLTETQTEKKAEVKENETDTVSNKTEKGRTKEERGKAKHPVFIDPASKKEYKAILFGADIRTGWEWFGFQKESSDIYYGFVHGFEDEWGSFSLSELKENNVHVTIDPKELDDIMPPVGWTKKETIDKSTKESTIKVEEGEQNADTTGERTEGDNKDSLAGEKPGDVPATKTGDETTNIHPRHGKANTGNIRTESDNSERQDTLGEEQIGVSGKKSGARDVETSDLGKHTSDVLGVSDYRIQPGELRREGGWKATALRNIEIIELVKKLNEEKRQATPQEQALLIQFTGWGASEIRNKLFPGYARLGELRPDWADAEWKPLVERLKDALTDEELKTAARSTQYAHYTSEGVIRSIYNAIEQFGFKGGTLLEPGSGNSLFAGLIPDSIKGSSKYTGIELDHLTSEVAKHLFPQQIIMQGDFVKQKLPDNFYDLGIGNPPFAKIKIVDDPKYRKYGFSLHDYFFAKTIDKVRPGGLLVFVTSRYTMDKMDSKARKYIGDRADLLGVIRLPQTAFKQQAGTEVITDVIFLRKREEGQVEGGKPWQKLAEIKTPEGNANINEYFASNPEMILGRNSYRSGQYGAEYTVLPLDGNIEDHFAKATENLPKNVYSVATKPAAEQQVIVIERDFNPKSNKEGNIYISDKKKLLIVDQGSGVPVETIYTKLTPKDKEWLKGYVELRSAVKQAQYDQLKDGDWQKSLKQLNKAYDAFVKKHGPVSQFTTYDRTTVDDDGNKITVEYRRYKNEKLLRVDVESSLIEALEVIKEDGTIIKGPFLDDRTIKTPLVKEVKTIHDAIAVSLNDYGKFDITDIAKKMNMDEKETIEAMGDMVYKNPSGTWEMSDQYLSGDVRQKLDEARAAAQVDSQYKRNVDALTKAQPAPLTNRDIAVILGANWINDKIVTEFADEVLGLDINVVYDKRAKAWTAGQGSGSRRARYSTSEWGTSDRSAQEILDSVLNNRQLKIIRRDSDGKTWTDTEATAKINDIAKKMIEKFQSWIWQDSARATELLNVYNEKYNNIAPRKFEGAHLTLPGASLRFKLHKHQLDGIWRIIQDGNAYLAHAVGAGKTFVQIAAGMEMKRMGLIRKPLYVVPKHMLRQFSSEFQELYPMANIMVADEENFHTNNRRRFMAQASLNNPDAIIITHSALGLISMKPENVNEVRDKFIMEMRDLLADLEEDRQGNRHLIRNVENRIEQLERQFSKISGSEKQDKALTMEEMDVDFMFLDEAHEFRKLEFITNRKVKGIDGTGSMKAMDLYIKTLYLDKQSRGRSHVFASGTPVTNTIGELFTIMRFFDNNGQMDRDGIDTFDMWANMFGQTAIDFERNSAGKYESVERFSKFMNVPELMRRVRTFMDVLTSQQLGGYVDRPDIKGGSAEIVLANASPELKEYMKSLEARIKVSRNWKPSPSEKGNPDPMINIITDGRLANIDIRFVKPTSKSDPKSKLNTMIDGIIETHKRIAKQEFADIETGKLETIKGGTQIVFFNVGFGQAVANNRGFDAKAWTAKRLKDAKIPAHEIAFIDDFDTAPKKESLFKDMRSGKKRILIGSAKKMGTGINIQKRLYKLHFLDAPWYPADVEQPHGRIIRQGNQHGEIELAWYATKESYDSTMWQMVSRKSKFIEQAFSGDESVRSLDDISESGTYAQAAALASGDERLLQLVGLQNDIARLSTLKSAHERTQMELTNRKSNVTSSIEFSKKRLVNIKKVAAMVPDYIRDIDGEIKGKKYDNREEFGKELIRLSKESVSTKIKGDLSIDYIAKMNGFDIGAKRPNSWSSEGIATGAQVTLNLPDVESVEFTITDAETSPTGLVSRIVNELNRLDRRVEETESDMQEKSAELIRINKQIGAPFEYASEMADKISEGARLQDELEAEGKEDTFKISKDKALPSFEVFREWDGIKDEGEFVSFKVNKKTDELIGNEMVDIDDVSTITINRNEYDSVKGSTEQFKELLKSKVSKTKPIAEIEGQSPSFSRSESAIYSPMSVKDVKTAILDIQDKWNNGPSIKVVQGYGQLPNRLQGSVIKSEGKGAIRGIFDPDTKGIYLIASNISSALEAETTVLHEAIGHYGLRGLLGKDIQPILGQAFLVMNKEARAIAKQYGIDTSKMEGRAQAAEEALARMAERGESNNIMQKAYAVIRNWLRKMGFTIKLNDSDLRDLIARARKYVEGGKKQGMAGAIAFSQKPKTSTPAFKAWFKDSKVVDDKGEPLVVYHGTPSPNFSEFKDGNIYLTNNEKIAEQYTARRGLWLGTKQGAIYPVFASLKNPLIIDAQGKRHNNIPVSWQTWKPTVYGNLPKNAQNPTRIVIYAKDKGYDSVIIKNVIDTVDVSDRTKSDVYIAFDPTQIKSAIGNVGTFDTNNLDIRFSRKADPIISEKFDVPEEHSTMAAIKGAFEPGKVNLDNAKKVISEARTQILDRMHPIEQLGDKPYVLHRMLGNAHATISTFLQHGKLSWKDQALTVKTKDEGFLPWLHGLGDDSRNLFYWIATQRAERLEAEGRENWLDGPARRKIKDSIFKGLSPQAREAKEAEFRKLNNEFQQWNRNVIDIAKEAGLLSDEQIDSWTRDFYMPFYRIMEDPMTSEEFISAPHKSKQYISAQIKRLKGGEEKLGDPISNILRNWSHLIQESQRNVARSEAADSAIELGLANVVPKSELIKILGAQTVKQWAVKPVGSLRATRLFEDPDTAKAYAQKLKRNTGNKYEVTERKTTMVKFGRKEDFNIISYQKEGKPIFLRVPNPELFNAMSEVNIKAFDSGVMKIMTAAKRLLTFGATFTPAFRIANALRDTLHSSVVSKNFAPFFDTARGLVKVWKESAEYIELMASGGGFGHGYIESGDPKAMARSIEKILKREGQGVRGNILDTPRRMLAFWDRIGHASEMAARVQLYSNLKIKGETHLKAAYEARDLLDFFRSGSGNAVRVINSVTPFLNARVQGLDRLYRGAKQDPKAFFTKGAIVAAASLLLWGAYKDDDRYKELEDWEKWQYHHFWIGSTHYRIPKAFEVGAIFSSLFETSANVLDGQEDFDFFMRFLGHTLTQTFAVGMPAAFSPGIEAYSNKSFFTGRPIESFSQQRLPAGERSNPWTPELLKDLGRGLNLSPVKMESILRGHTAAFGTIFLTVADSFYRLAIDAPARPALRVNDVPGMGRFVRDETGRTKHATRYYEFAREVSELTATISNYKKLGDLDKAREVIRENRDTYKYRRLVSYTQKQLSYIRKQELRIWASDEMSSIEKRDALQELSKRKSLIYRKAYDKIFP